MATSPTLSAAYHGNCELVTNAGVTHADGAVLVDGDVEHGGGFAAGMKPAGEWTNDVVITFPVAILVEALTVGLPGRDPGSDLSWIADGVTVTGTWVNEDTGGWDCGVVAWDYCTWTPDAPLVVTVLTLRRTLVYSGLGGYYPELFYDEILVNGAPIPDYAGVYADWDGDGFGDPASDDDLTSDVASWSITRGASAEVTGGSQPGSATIVLNNPADDRYNPLNPAGLLYGKLTDGVPIWIGVNSDGASTGTDPRGLFGGRIKDVTPLLVSGASQAPQVEITCEDALGWYGRTPVRLSYAAGRSQHDFRLELLAAGGETRMDLAHEIATLPLSDADGALLSALEAINAANGTRHFAKPSDERTSWYTYTTRNRQWRLDATVDAAFADATEITGSSGWRLSADTVINRQKASVTPVVFTSGLGIVWEASTLPVFVTVAHPYELMVEFDDFVDAPVLDIGSTGAAITKTLTPFGRTAKIGLTVASGAGIVHSMNIRGRLARRALDESHVADDTASQAAQRGIRSGPDISGDVVGTIASARGIAEHVVWRYGSPQYRPTMTVEDAAPEQFELDLYDLVAVSIAAIGISGRLFEIVGVTHEPIAPPLYRTTYVLQECRVQDDPGWFVLDASLLDSADILAY